MIACDSLNNHCEYDRLLPMKCELMPRVYFRLVPTSYQIEENLQLASHTDDTKNTIKKDKLEKFTKHNSDSDDTDDDDNLAIDGDDEDGIAGANENRRRSSRNRNLNSEFDQRRKLDGSRYKKQFHQVLKSLDPSWAFLLDWMIEFRYNTVNNQFASYYGFLWFRSQFEAERTIKYLNHYAFGSEFRCVAQLTVDTTCAVYLPLKNMQNMKLLDNTKIVI